MQLRSRLAAPRAAEVTAPTSSPVPSQPTQESPAPVAAAAAADAATAAAAVVTPGPSEPVANDVKGDMLAPSAANKAWVRVVATLAVTAAVASTSVLTPGQGWNFVALLAWGIWLGATIFNTFCVGLTMFKNMPRQTFGRVQSKLFPQYFALTTGANLVLLAGAVAAGAPTNHLVTLGVAAAGNVLNWLVIEPIATGLMFARYDIENKPNKTEQDQADIKALYKKFGMWHGISSLNNLITLACSVAYGWALAGALAL